MIDAGKFNKSAKINRVEFKDLQMVTVDGLKRLGY